jgi:hypothetical protein
MPVDPKRIKPDNRSPQQLAKAILDHEFTPRVGEIRYSTSFREQLLMDYQTDYREVADHGEPLVITLKALEEGSPPRPDDKRRLRHALQVIDAYKIGAAEWRDDGAREARDTVAGPHTEALRRAAAESMETRMVEISNLKAIERLVRALAHNLGVSLVEPGRSK